MRVVAFSDPHSDLDIIREVGELVKQEKPELVICAGDITWCGRGLKETLKAINEFQAPVFLIHGNHENLPEVESIIEEFSNITFIHKRIVMFKDFLILGYGGGGFSDYYPDFDLFVKKHEKKLSSSKLIIVNHAPPYGTSLDISNWTEEHSGSKSFRDFIKRFKPKAAFCGHFHESFFMEEVFEETLIANPGPEGMVFEI